MHKVYEISHLCVHKDCSAIESQIRLYVEIFQKTYCSPVSFVPAIEVLYEVCPSLHQHG